jgi:hypothetical protein
MGDISGKMGFMLEFVENIVFYFLQTVFPNVARLGVPTSTTFNFCKLQCLKTMVATVQNIFFIKFPKLSPFLPDIFG